MLDFLNNSWLEILWFALLISSILLLKTNKKPQAKKIIYALVLAAEKYFGSRMGMQKFDFVFNAAYSYLPVVISENITQEELKDMIEKAVIRMKEEGLEIVDRQ